MEAVHLFSLASQQASWLSARQTAVAQNVANADTPRYRAVDVQPFSEVFDRTALRLTATDPRHLGGGDAALKPTRTRAGSGWETTHSGNSVSLEQEMIKAGEINNAFSLNRSIVATFGRMLTAAAKG